MTDPKSAGIEPTVTPPPPPKRSPGHRAADVRDTVAEMAEKAKEISQEAGSKVAAAMKELITAAAGLAGFAVESARDLVQFMVRRGQMTQEEADKLMKEVEATQPKRKIPPPAPTRKNTATAPPPVQTNKSAAPRSAKSASPQSAQARKAVAPPPAKAPIEKKSAPKTPAGKALSKPTAKNSASKKAAAKKPAPPRSSAKAPARKK